MTLDKKIVHETRNYLLDEIKHSDLKSEKHKKVCSALNYFKNFLIIVSAVSSCVSISAFALLVGVSLVIASSAIELKV